MEKKNYKISYSYDELNRLATVTLDGGIKKHYVYDQAGNLIRISSIAPEAGEAPAAKVEPPVDWEKPSATETRFAVLGEEYDSLNDLAQAGAISLEEFQEKVNALRLQDAAGIWWQLRSDGAWLKCDGANWTEAKPDN